MIRFDEDLALYLFYEAFPSTPTPLIYIYITG